MWDLRACVNWSADTPLIERRPGPLSPECFTTHQPTTRCPFQSHTLPHLLPPPPPPRDTEPHPDSSPLVSLNTPAGRTVEGYDGTLYHFVVGVKRQPDLLRCVMHDAGIHGIAASPQVMEGLSIPGIKLAVLASGNVWLQAAEGYEPLSPVCAACCAALGGRSAQGVLGPFPPLSVTLQETGPWCPAQKWGFVRIQPCTVYATS